MTDHFSPRIIVGNTPNGDPAGPQGAPFQYFADPGDGSGIVAALAVAGAGFDVRIRPGTYTLPVGTHLVVPAGVSVSGEPGGVGAPSGTIIVASAGAAGAGNQQDVFTLGVGAVLQDVQIRVPAGTQGGQVGNAIVNLPAAIARVSRVLINMIFGGTAERNTTIAFGTASGVSSPSADTLIEECEVILPQVASTGGFVYAHVLFGGLGVDSTTGATEGPVVRDCRFLGGQVGVLMVSISGGTVLNCSFFNLINSAFGGYGVFWILQATALNNLFGPHLSGNSVVFNAVGDGANRSIGYNIEHDVTVSQGTAIVEDWSVVDCRVLFSSAITTTELRGFQVIVGSDGIGQIRRGTIADCISVGHSEGVRIESDTTTNDATAVGAISDVTLSNVNVAAPRNLGGGPNGIAAQIANVPLQPKIERLVIIGCNASQAPAPGHGIVLNSLGVDRTIVSSNQLTPTTGVALLDAGTLTQVGVNQVV
jgi:hypothetical protein